MSDRQPISAVDLAIKVMADVPLSPADRLREVACLAIARHSHEGDYRAAGVEEDEIEEGCRTMGRLAADMARMRFPVQA